MKGTVIMRSSKERKHEKKRKNKEMGVARTEKSRARRLANKAKRDEIHAIDPDIKVKIINQVTYIERDNITEDGIIYKPIEAINGKINTIIPVIEPEVIKITEAEKGRAIDVQVEKERIGVFNPFKWKKK